MTMRFPLAIAACLGYALIATPVSAQSQNESTSRLLVLNSDSATQSNGGVPILRGSPAPSQAASAPYQDEVLGAGRWQAVGGERFWMFDRQTGKLAGCINRQTANVGEREIECNFGTLSRFRRTFGNNFRH
jgi:hypothetical protein